MQYFILPIVLVIYFELLGQCILSYLKIDKEIFNYSIGYIVIMAISYITTSIITALNLSFYLVFFIFLLIFITSVIFIYKNRHSITFKFNISYSFILLISLFILVYFTLNTTLGELNGFDSTHYLNMVTGNIGQTKLNYNNVVFGDFSKNISSQYTFQSFYYFASVILFVAKKLFNIFGIEFFYAQGYIWCFQILFYLSFLSMILIALNKLIKKHYLLKMLILTLMVFGYGKLYYNSAFGFYGNTFRTIFVAYAIYFLIEYFKNKDNSKALFALSMLAACAASSTAVFEIIFLYFALFFIEIKNNNRIFKEYILMLFIPMINLITILFEIRLAFVLSILILITLFIFNDKLVSLFRKYRFERFLLVFSILVMFLLSLNVTGNVFDFSAFFNNGSEIYDMTLDYFDLEIGYEIIKIYKLFSLMLLAIYCIFKRNDDYAKIIFILILVFFNPFVCSFLNKVNVVYYRSYELILNPFTFIFFIKCMLEVINKEIVIEVASTIGVIFIFYRCNLSMPLYWHESFIPGNDYNPIYKITNEELNIIREIDSLISYEKIEEPKIVTPNLITQSMIPNGIYIYGREYQINPRWTGSEKAIYDIFWPVLHYGDARQPNNPDYDNMCEYIKDANIDFIVQPKSTEYYDESQNIWYSLTYKIDECGSYAFYETENYSVYNFER